MLTPPPEIVRFLIKRVGTTQTTIAKDFGGVSKSVISKQIVKEELIDINDIYKTKVINYFSEKYDIPKEVFTLTFKDTDELESYLLSSPLENEILTSLIGKWHLYAHVSRYEKPAIETIYSWEIETFKDKRFSINRVEAGIGKEFGKIEIEDEAIQLKMLDKVNRNRYFFSISFTYNDIKNSNLIIGFMAARNMSAEKISCIIYNYVKKEN